MSIADELKKLSDLKDSGILTEEEYDIQKHKLLAGPASPPSTQSDPLSTTQKSMATKDIGCLGGLYGIAALGGLVLLCSGLTIGSNGLTTFGVVLLLIGSPLLFVRMRYMWSGTNDKEQ
mgnify:CR=1 FL=1